MTAQQQANRKRAKNVAKGAAVVAGTAVTAYAVSKLLKGKNSKIAIEKGKEAYSKFVDENYRTTSITQFKDNTYISKSRDLHGNVREIIEGTAGEKTFDTISRNNHKNNMKVWDEAGNVYQRSIDKANKANTREAARNVAEYYKDKYRR